MRQFFKKLNEPFPESENFKDNIKSIIGVGIFITFFLFFFQVGGMNSYSFNTFLMCLNFGVITMVVATTLDLFASKVLKIKKNEPSWTLKKWIIYMFVLLILISQFNFAYFSYLNGFKNFKWDHFGIMVFYTIAVGIFPVVFSGLIVQLKSNQKNQIQAADLQTNLPHQKNTNEFIHLFSENKKQELKILANDILYIEAMQNYVSICYRKENKSQKELIRNTIKNIESQLAGTQLIRCHRSFIVNANLISKIEGNAQGLKLRLLQMEDFHVPVSRKYIPILRQLIN